MEPRLPAPNRGPEIPSTNYGSTLEHGPVQATPETAIERPAERIERQGEAARAVAEASTPILPAPVMPVVAPAPPAPDPTTSLADDLPSVANDDDLIEKEWVDKAKKIIVQTKDDPYRREQEVSKLQADYLEKRYGRKLGVSQ